MYCVRADYGLCFYCVYQKKEKKEKIIFKNDISILAYFVALTHHKKRGIQSMSLDAIRD